MRVFLDTNVLVSAFASRGICADVLHLVLAEHELIVGEVTLAELRRVLAGKIGLPATVVDEIAVLLREQIVVPKPRRHLTLGVRDPDDEWIVASAVAGKADILVTGDRDLLDMVRKAPVRIVDPRGFWEALQSA